MFPEAFAQGVGASSRPTRMVLVRGGSSATTRSARLLATEIVSIEAVREQAAREVAIRLAMPPHGRATVEALLGVLARHRATGAWRSRSSCAGGGRPLRVQADVLGADRASSRRRRWSPSVEQVCGEGTVSLR